MLASIGKTARAALEWIVAILFGAFVVVMVAQVVARGVFGFSFHWSLEFTRYTFVWMVFLASVLAVRVGAHLGFDLVISRLPDRVQKVAEGVGHVLTMVFMALFAWLGLELVGVAGSATSPSLEVPMSGVYLVMPVAAVLMFLQTLILLLRLILRGDKPEKPVEGDAAV